MTLGQRFRRARREADLSQKAAAAALHMTQSALSKIESDSPHARELRASEIVAAAQLYHCSSDYLLGIKDLNTQMREDLSRRLDRLPLALAKGVIEHLVYLLHDYAEDAGTLRPTKNHPDAPQEPTPQVSHTQK